MSAGFTHILNVSDAREAAKRRLPRGLFEYIDRGTEDEMSIAANRRRLDAIQLAPSVLIDVSQRSQAAKFLGRRQLSPLIIAPTAVAGLVWHDGEIELAKAAAKAGIPFCVSTQSITSVERIAEESRAHLWFQLYIWKNRQRTLALIERAWAAGAQTLMLTVDTPATPNREYNLRNGFGIPLKPSLRAGIDLMVHPRWTLAVLFRSIMASGVPTYAHYPNGFRTKLGRAALSDEVNLATDVTWEDVRLLRRHWKGKLILKGILRVDDALNALSHGADAIVVSNHGARNLDCAPGPTDVLPAIAEAVGGRMDILADSGVRRGSDAARFIALGAKGVLIGRATLYGLAIGGAQGAARVLDLLTQELSIAMGLLGARSLDDLGRCRCSEPQASRRGLD